MKAKVNGSSGLDGRSCSVCCLSRRGLASANAQSDFQSDLEAIEEKQARFKKDYFAQFAKAASAKTAARFTQGDSTWTCS
jgi:hypothetical protein